MADTLRTCAYAGLIDIPIRAQTTTYSPMYGLPWQFNPQSLIPMEFRGCISGAFACGMWAKIFDLNVGITEIKIGNISAIYEATSTFAYPCWQNNSLVGWFNPLLPNNRRTYTYSYAAMLGQSYTSTRGFRFGCTAAISPTATNTQFPQPYGPVNYPAVNNTVANSATENLFPILYLYDGLGTIAHNYYDMGVGGSSAQLGAGIPYYMGASWVTTMVPSTPTSRRRLLATNYFNQALYYQMYWAPPPGLADIDGMIIGDVDRFTATYNGFIETFHNNITVEGQPTPYGFAVLMEPNGIRYWILRWIPLDAASKTTLNLIGDIQVKTDLSGALWLKNVNIQNTILISAGSVLKLLPIYFPIPVPDSYDGDLSVRMMRSEPNGE